jgi:hypothetical protein
VCGWLRCTKYVAGLLHIILKNLHFLKSSTEVGGGRREPVEDEGRVSEMRLGVEEWARVEETSEHCP